MEKFYKKMHKRLIRSARPDLLLRFLMVPLINRKPILINNSFYMYTDKYDSPDLIANKTYEPKITKFFNENARKNTIMLDIGANIGYYSILSARICDKVYAFEPEHNSYRRLLKNIRLNNMGGKIIAEEKALSDKKQKLQLEIQPFNLGGHYVIENGYKNRWPIKEVQGISLDEYFKDKQKPDYIKMDVQGYEPTVIKGGMKTFKNAKFIIFEDTSHQACKQIESLGFKVHSFNDAIDFYGIREKHRQT